MTPSCHPIGSRISGGNVNSLLPSHPERLHLSIRLLALEAMREAWPCKSWWRWWW